MEREEEGAGRSDSAVPRLIEKATSSTRPEVEPRLLKAIKSVVRHSDSDLRCAAQTLLFYMTRDHSQVRYLSLLIIDELFMRSKLFRAIVVENLDQLLTLSVGFRKNLPLPAPAAVATTLRSKAIEFLEKWNVSFGIHYRQLRLGYDYLKNTLRYQFPNLQANAQRIQQERREREIRTKQILLSKFEILKANLASIKADIQSTVDEVTACMDIIRNQDDGDEDIPLASLDDQDMEMFHNSELRQIRLNSLREGEKVHENSENKVIFDALRELYKVIVTKHLVTIQEWTSVLIRVEVEDVRFRDNTLKELIDIRNNLQSVKKMCEESGCSLPKTTTEEEDDIWEEGMPESSSNGKSLTAESDKEGVPEPSSNGQSLTAKNADFEVSVAPTSSKLNVKVSECSNSTSKGKKKLGIDGNPLRNQLLSEAPVLPWGSYLDTWDGSSHRDVLANQRGLDIEGHWGRVDHDAVIPAQRIAELSMQATIYREDPVEIQPCRAPLRKGGLCPRKDLRVCPFHGPIIPRDDEGKPINTSNPSSSEGICGPDVVTNGDSSEEEKEIITPDIVAKLAKQAVDNVRERDKVEEAKKASKRARLAKVREHNEAVLRDAALSASMYSCIGEESEAAPGGGSRPSARNKKETLASMKKKKITPKDRLAQKLLGTRARDATTRQLTMEEESKYKEAFPNQW
ncbi:OLC1v1038361C1 [Oldenlandia corymbosa var. corymbosa]|uniref:OLC1v1038361C1 n=1 Tax=Oldenlandia corymbosa var. corymbosa TaxID=529605 RepID=A0AAV1D076_OLDCO|nr:OLC1v1038361C1 [Oldenlandia corymbosa var. corymbosa]